MDRCAHLELEGKWVPLDTSTIRRGSMIRSVAPSTTATTNTYNFRIGEQDEHQLCKVVGVDSDGDAKIVALSDAAVAGLLIPSEHRWLLNSSYTAFEVLAHPKALTDVAKKTNQHRKQKAADD
mmetsp:Transcript_4368/g.6769  ORF Transcript_4368/g.6769 Transcript_4368/m.6769 type:complete len:123 (+) Transcript_4368:563-931(+)